MCMKKSTFRDTETDWEKCITHSYANLFNHTGSQRGMNGPGNGKSSRRLIYFPPPAQPSEIRSTIACDRLLPSLPPYILYDKFNAKWQSQHAFRALSKKTNFTEVRTQWTRKCECTPRAYLKTLISMRAIMVIYGLGDINIWKDFTKGALGDCEILLLRKIIIFQWVFPCAGTLMRQEKAKEKAWLLLLE